MAYAGRVVWTHKNQLYVAFEGTFRLFSFPETSFSFGEVQVIANFGVTYPCKRLFGGIYTVDGGDSVKKSRVGHVIWFYII